LHLDGAEDTRELPGRVTRADYARNLHIERVAERRANFLGRPEGNGGKEKNRGYPGKPPDLSARARTLVVELYDDFCLIWAEGGEEEGEEEEEEEERTAPLAARPCEGCSRVRPL